MNKFFAALTVLTLVLGTVAFAAPASASGMFLFAPNPYEGTQGRDQMSTARLIPPGSALSLFVTQISHSL